MDSWTSATAKWRAEMLAAHRSPGTIRLWQSYLHRLARVSPSPATVDRHLLIAWLARPDWSPETSKSARSALVSFFSWAHRYGGLSTNPAADLPPIRVPEADPRPAPDEAIREALLRADNRTTLMILLACVAGMRRAEIAVVHSHDLSPAGELTVHGKGGRRRTIALPPDLARAIRLHGPGYVFPSPQGTRQHLTEGHVGKLISRALPDGYTPHQLRHAAASALHDLGLTMFEIRRFLGHSNVRTTQRYVAIRERRTAAAVAQLQDRYRGRAHRGEAS